MKRLLFIALLFAFTALQAQQARTVSFDEGWLFYRGAQEGAAQTGFNDKQWRKLDVPHDWSIEDLPGTQSPFDSTAEVGVHGGFTVGGTGWYRKHFIVPASAKGKRVVIQFDGVYMNADVWINGIHLGCQPYGYTSFTHDLTPYVITGKENVIAVSVRNEGRNSRWYSGSGIYRHVWLLVLPEVHVAQWGTVITTAEANAQAAKLNAGVTVKNETAKPVTVTTVVRIMRKQASGSTEAGRMTATQTIAAGASAGFAQTITVKQPALWSVENPSLYTAVTEVYRDKQLTDKTETVFGIRKIVIDAVNGFQLNGKAIKLKGGCVHHDNGPLGAKAYDRAEERRVALLKASGFNAIRCSHNPPSPAFLDACDRLGMLVIDEAFDMWKDKKHKQDYHLYFEEWWQRDIEAMVYRDRNHPSVVMWSIGNEIPNRDKPEVVAVAKMLADHIRKIEPTRPVTCGVNGIEENKDPFIATLDVAGYNYAYEKYGPDHQRLPNRVMYGSESFVADVYENWREINRYPWVIGDFVWTSFDHIGEASIGWLGYPQRQWFYPWNLAYVGDIDICGWKRPQSYHRDAVWNKNQLSVFVKPPVPSFPQTNPKPEVWSRWNAPDLLDSWTWPGAEGKPLEITVYSSCEEAELFLNGVSLGKKASDTASHYKLSWEVPYAKGELSVKGYAGGKQVAFSSLKTAGEVKKLKVIADRNVLKADGQDLSYIEVDLVDANGVRQPQAENLVKFELQGPGTIVAVGNARPESIESYQLPQRQAWRGRCMVIVKTAKKAGKITLNARVDGIPVGSVVLEAK
ncbi:glycoside hydrolase family 2 TIM barrel-domain containing protein [Filimonas effusa]|uniref:Glycoside hydrolase family 2 protein n=1 Tax=Filimonas effusa TaxID=2508721 RepID=A0A4V1MAW3_9BACT|nr:glycoside hydrolase family 2 TIM barrel-domain containing protein [Filimonas effusa]RXK87276.1 glycoside hydrolase family 2 protein [Filimonas effusa]